MADEYIRLDTTIIAIDRLINEAATGTMARTLFKAKDTLYSQQRYVTDVQPVKRGRWEQAKSGDEEYLYLSTILGIPVEDLPKYAYCSECHFSFATKGTDKTGNALIHKAIYRYCPNCGARMDLKDGDTK